MSCQHSKRVYSILLRTAIAFVSLVLLCWALHLVTRHSDSLAVGALAVLVSFAVAVLCLLWGYRRSPAISAALTLLAAAMTAGEVSHRLGGAPQYAPHGVLSLAAGTAVGGAACLLYCFVVRRKEQRTRPQADGSAGTTDEN